MKPLFMCVFSIRACVYGVEGARGSQKMLGSLELELHAVVNLSICVLGVLLPADPFLHYPLNLYFLTFILYCVCV